MNTKSVIKVAKALDISGKYEIADKLDKYLKFAQEAAPQLITQLPGTPARFNIPGMFGTALTSEGLRGGTQGFKYIDKNDPFYDPIKGALFSGSGPDQAYVNKDFISGQDYLKGMQTPEGQLNLYNRIRQQMETQQSSFVAPYAAKGRIDQEISFLNKTLQRTPNPYDAYKAHKNNLVALLRDSLAYQNENQWADLIQYFKTRMPANLAVQANEVVNTAKQEAIGIQQAKALKTQQNVQTVMNKPETVAPTNVPQAAPVQAPALAQPVVETPEQKAEESAKYQQFLSNFNAYLNTNDVNSMIAVRNMAKQTFKNPQRLNAFTAQTNQLASQKGINLSSF